MIDRVPLSFVAGTVVGALAAALLFAGVLFAWACFIIARIG